MTIRITDAADVKVKALELGCNVPLGMAILPHNFFTVSDRSEFQQLSEAATVRSLFRQHGIVFEELISLGQPTTYIQNNGFEWIAPVLFITSSFLSENQAVISVALSVIANYVTEFFKGIPGNPEATLEIVVERDRSSLCKRVSYKGDVAGIAAIVDAIRAIQND